MLELLKKLLFQIRCGYCFKPISENEERRLGDMSLCPDCYSHIKSGYSTANSLESSKDFSKVKKQAVSKRKSRHFHNGIVSKEETNFQSGKSGENLPLFLRLFYKPFRGGFR